MSARHQPNSACSRSRAEGLRCYYSGYVRVVVWSSAQWYCAFGANARGTGPDFTEPDMSTRLIDALFWVAVVACAVAQLFILRAVFRISPRLPASNAGNSASGNSLAATNGVASTSDPLAANGKEPYTEQYNVPTPHRATELLWVMLPVVLLVLAFVGAWQVMHPTSLLPDFIRQNSIPVKP